jgi:hypothetical protein
VGAVGQTKSRAAPRCAEKEHKTILKRRKKQNYPEKQEKATQHHAGLTIDSNLRDTLGNE